MFRFSSLDNIWCFYQLFNYIVVCLKRPRRKQTVPGRLNTLIALMCIETRYQFNVFRCETQRESQTWREDYASDVRTRNISIFPALIIKSHSVWCKINFPWKSTWLFSALNTVLRKPPRFHSPEAHSVSGRIFNDHNFYAVLSRAIKFPLNGILFKTMRTLIGVSMSSRLGIKLAPHPERLHFTAVQTFPRLTNFYRQQRDVGSAVVVDCFKRSAYLLWMDGWTVE